MYKFALSMLHFAIITFVSLAILLGVSYTTFLNEAFWIKNIQQHTLVPPAAAPSASSLSPETDITGVVLRALPQEALQAESEGLVKATFAWLRGETKAVEYKPNLEAMKPQIVASLEQQYLEQFKANPIQCPPSGIITDAETGVNIPCGSLPTDPSALANVYAENVANGVIRESQQNPTPQSSVPFDVPTMYQFGAVAAWVTPVLSLALVVLTTLVAREKLRQLSYIGRHITLALIPNLLLIGGGLLLMSISLQLSPQAIADLQQYGLGGLLRAMTREAAILYLIVTLIVMSLSVAIWIIARQIAKHAQVPDEPLRSQPPTAAQSPRDTL